MKRLIFLVFCTALSTQAYAQIDTNSNLLSDIWEMASSGGSLFTASNPAHAPAADPDGDGFTNLIESRAGTHPFDATDFPAHASSFIPPVYEASPPSESTPQVLIDPPVSILTWPTVPGKTYEAIPSEDLADWTATTGAFLGNGTPHTFESETLYPGDTVPPKLFWRVEINDTDSDRDGLTDYEELHITDPSKPSKTLDPFNADTDGDGIFDGIEYIPGTNGAAAFTNFLQVAWDADSENPSGAPLFASFNFTPPSAGGHPFTAERVTDISGNNRHGKARNVFHGEPAAQKAPQDNAEGISNHGFRCANSHHFAFDLINPGINFAPVAGLSFWLKTKAADLEGSGQPVFSYVPKLGVFAQNPNTENPYAARAFIRKQPVGTGYEVVWFNWSFPGNIVRERWTLDLTAPQLDERWINLTFVWQGGSGDSQSSYWACYANGVKQMRTLNSTHRFQTTPKTPNTPQDTFLIGADAAGGSGQNNLATVQSTFKGTMDRVRIYTAKLTDQQILAIFRQDTDADGLWDSTEADGTAWKDTNGNGRRDIGEIRYPNSSPTIWQPLTTDSDDDEITDIHEQNVSRTDPYNHDSDADLLPDGWEVANNLDPNSAAGIHGQTGNIDNDGLDNFQEWQHLTNPHLADSDGDQVNDGAEIVQGSDPNSSADNGQAPPPDEKLTLKIVVGDPSSSHSERWRVEATEMDSGEMVLRHASRAYGKLSDEAQSVFNRFKPGKAYSFKLIHAGTDPEKLYQDPEFFPDYDWALEISYKDANGNFIDLIDNNQNRYLVLDPYNPGTRSLQEDNVTLLVNRDELAYPWEGDEDRTEQYERQILPMQVVMLPMETVTGIPGSEDESPGNWLVAESHPRPSVEMSVVSAIISGNDLEVTIQGTVTDALSEYAHYSMERPQNLVFKHQDGVLHTVKIPATITEGYQFEETFTIPDAEPMGYVIRAESTENSAGLIGYDEIAVSLGWQENPAAFPTIGSPISIHFPAAPTSQTTDQAIVYVGTGNPPQTHGQTTETSADSSEFTGSYLIPTPNGNLTADCQFAFSSPPVFSTTHIDSVIIWLTTDLQSHPSNQLYTRWIETAPNSRIFREQVEWSFKNQVLTVLGTENLRGTSPSFIESCTVRLPSLPDGGDDPGEIRILAGDRKYRLIRIDDHWYPEDPAKRGTPKLFLPSTDPMPSRLKAHGYDPQTGYFDLSLRLDDATTFGQAARFHVVPARDIPDAPLAAPLAARAAVAPDHWQPGEPVDTHTVLSAYRFLHADSSFALELLAGYLRGNHLIETKNLLTGYLDLDVDLGFNLTDLNDNIWTIQIEEDINPIHAANLLFEGLKRAYLEIEVHRNHNFEGEDDAEAFRAAMQQAVLATQKTTIAATELYLSGLGVINEGLDWIIIVNDVADGHPESLAAALPFVSAGLVKSGGNLVIKNASGEVLDSLDSAAFRELRELGLEGNLEAAGTVFDEYGYSLFLRKALTSDFAPVRVPGDKEHGKLRKAMENIGAPPGRDYDAHHDFPWAERQWFADHGIDVNEPGYGRWIQKDKHGGWHGWRGGQFNAWWRAVKADEATIISNGGQPFTKQQIVQKLVECRQQFPSTP